MGPVTAAKHMGIDWKSLTTEERKLVSETCRVSARFHEEKEVKLRIGMLQIVEENHRLRDRLKNRTNEIINRKAKKGGR